MDIMSGDTGETPGASKPGSTPGASNPGRTPRVRNAAGLAAMLGGGYVAGKAGQNLFSEPQTEGEQGRTNAAAGVGGMVVAGATSGIGSNGDPGDIPDETGMTPNERKNIAQTNQTIKGETPTSKPGDDLKYNSGVDQAEFNRKKIDIGKGEIVSPESGSYKDIDRKVADFQSKNPGATADDLNKHLGGDTEQYKKWKT
jgi:hypothetical protein